MIDSDLNLRLLQALESLNTPWSIDRIIVDPDLNAEFLQACLAIGLTDEASILNRRLMNLRKRASLPRTIRSRKTSFSNEAEYRFAAEIAIRAMERRTSFSLDEILCDPTLAVQFDQLASEIAPGYSPLQYRWAALNLRKARRLLPEILGRVVQSVSVLRFGLGQVVIQTLPAEQGLYIFHEAHETLYVGEAQNLRNRLKTHLDHSDNKGLARWLWEHGSSGVFLELHTLPKETPTYVRRALETELIRSRRPLFNVQR